MKVSQQISILHREIWLGRSRNWILVLFWQV